MPVGHPGVHVLWNALRCQPHVLGMKPLVPEVGQHRLRRPEGQGESPPSPVRVCVRRVVEAGHEPPQAVQVHWERVEVRDLEVLQHPGRGVSMASVSYTHLTLPTILLV